MACVSQAPCCSLSAAPKAPVTKILKALTGPSLLLRKCWGPRGWSDRCAGLLALLSDGRPEPALWRQAMGRWDGGSAPWCATPVSAWQGVLERCLRERQRHKKPWGVWEMKRRGTKRVETTRRRKKSRKQRREEAWYRKGEVNWDAFPTSAWLCFTVLSLRKQSSPPQPTLGTSR